MKDYETVPVDPETFRKFKQICAVEQRKQGAQFKVWVDAEYGRLKAENKLTDEPEQDVLKPINE